MENANSSRSILVIKIEYEEKRLYINDFYGHEKKMDEKELDEIINLDKNKKSNL